jgi:hypothetical protein
VEKEETLYTFVESQKVCFAGVAEEQGKCFAGVAEQQEKSVSPELRRSRVYGSKR